MLHLRGVVSRGEAEAVGEASPSFPVALPAETHHQHGYVVPRAHHAPGSQGVVQDGLAGLPRVSVLVHQFRHLGRGVGTRGQDSAYRVQASGQVCSWSPVSDSAICPNRRLEHSSAGRVGKALPMLWCTGGPSEQDLGPTLESRPSQGLSRGQNVPWEACWVLGEQGLGWLAWSSTPARDGVMHSQSHGRQVLKPCMLLRHSVQACEHDARCACREHWHANEPHSGWAVAAQPGVHSATGAEQMPGASSRAFQILAQSRPTSSLGSMSHTPSLAMTRYSSPGRRRHLRTLGCATHPTVEARSSPMARDTSSPGASLSGSHSLGSPASLPSRRRLGWTLAPACSRRAAGTGHRSGDTASSVRVRACGEGLWGPQDEDPRPAAPAWAYQLVGRLASAGMHTKSTGCMQTLPTIGSGSSGGALERLLRLLRGWMSQGPWWPWRLKCARAGRPKPLDSKFGRGCLWMLL